MHAGCLVVQQNSHILKRTAIGEFLLHDGGCHPHGMEALGGYFCRDSGGQGWARKWDAPGDFSRQMDECGQFTNAILSQGFKRFDNAIGVGLLGVDAQLGENVMLAFFCGVGQAGQSGKELFLRGLLRR